MVIEKQSISRFRFGLHVRSELRAGRTLCYQEINGAWYPIIDPVYPPVPTPITPNPNVQWLACQSCTGTSVGASQLQNATCEVCRM